MDNKFLTTLKGKHISVIVQSTPHPSSGFLDEVGEDYIILKQDTGVLIVVATNQIASIMIAKERTNENRVFQSG